jgi:hypothetical protein
VIYTDNGCTFESILGNAVFNNTSAQAWASRHSDFAPGHTTTFDPTDVENNFFQNPASTTTGGGITVAHNTTINRPSQIPASILANAGLESSFVGLLNWTQAPLPPVGGVDFSLSLSPGSQTVVAGASASYAVHTTGSAGAITLSVAGVSGTFATNPVAAGGDSTLTVTTSATDPGGTSAFTVTGTDATGTETVSGGLTVTGVGGAVTLSGLTVNDATNAANWSLQTNLQVGNTVYGDRAYTVSGLPAALVGGAWVRPANASKTVTANPLVTFTISQAATVYVATDTRLGKRPWMDASWVDTNTTMTTSENGTTRTYEVFRKAFPSGQVALGPQNTNTDMYTITVH